MEKYTNEQMKNLFLLPLLQFLKDKKAELEQKGYIPTLDLAIEQLEEQISLSEKDGEDYLREKEELK